MSYAEHFVKKLTLIVLTPFKTGSFFSSKNRSPDALRSFVVGKFTCIGCQSCYLGETKRHPATRIKEYWVTDRKSDIMKHLLENKTYKSLNGEGCFRVIMFALILD